MAEMRSRQSVRNPRSVSPTSDQVIKQRKQERRESIRWLEKFLAEALFERGPDGPYDGRIWEGPLRWDVVVICPDSRDPDDPLYREPYGHGALDAWIIGGGKLHAVVHGGPEEIIRALP